MTMKNHCGSIHNICCLAGILCSSGLAFAADREMSNAEIAKYFTSKNPEEGDWSRHFRVGALVGMNIKADFKINGSFGVSGSNPGQTGEAGRGQNHFYDDGYVLVDDTGNGGGATTYWGYKNADQYNAADQTLTFHSANSYTTSGSSSVDGDMQLGLDLAYGGHLFRYGRALVGWEFGFAWLPISIKDSQQLDATATRTVHRFSTGGSSIPKHPYDGSFGSDGYPTIQDIASLVDSNENAGTATVAGSRQLDVTLYNFRLGPTVHWELNRKLALSLSGGAAMGIVSGDLKHNETIVFSDSSTASNKGRTSNTELIYGGYVGATLMYHVEDQGDIYIGAQYMPLGRAKFGGGGRQATLDASGGLYFSAGFNWPF